MSLFGEADGWDSCYQGFGYAGSCSGCPYAANCPHEQQDDTGGHLITSMSDAFDDLLDSDDTYMDSDYEDEGVVICDGHNDLEDEDDRNDIHLFWPRGGV